MRNKKYFYLCEAFGRKFVNGKEKSFYIMKKIFGLFALMGAVTLGVAQTITFNTTTLDYGTVKQNSDGNRVFTIKNTGDKPLIISSVKPACGCTTPDFSKDPILPGKTGQIKVHYNTATLGSFQKLIEVFSNDPENSRSVIFIKGNVEGSTSTTPPAKGRK